MGVLNLTLGSSVESCPNITIPDETNYAKEGVFPSSSFKFHNYLSGNPTINTTFAFSAFVFGSYSFTTVSLSVSTDGTGNIIDPEVQYLAFVSLINEETSDIRAELVKPDGTSFKDWYVRVFSYDSTFASGTTSITSAAGITPVTSSISSVSTVTARNMSLYGPDGSVVDLGAVKQVDKITLNAASYEVGKTFIISFCGNSVSYDVESDNTAECVAKGIAKAINDVTDTTSLFYKYVTATSSSGVITLTAKEAGVPLNINVSFDGVSIPGFDWFTYSTVTGNTSSMSLPGETASNEVVYKAIEKGGEYTSVLTVVSGCDYNVDENDFFSWCYDIDNFECCFVSLLSKKECCKNSKNVYDDAATIQNVIKAISVMKKNNYEEAEIQQVVNLGHTICEPLKCNCGC